MGGGLFKETDEDREVRESAYRVTAGELRRFVERYEKLEEERAALAEGQRQVMLEAKARGYDTRVLKKVIALRKRDPQEVSEEAAVMQVYCEALAIEHDITGDLLDLMASGRADTSALGEPDDLTDEERERGDVAAFIGKDGTRMTIGRPRRKKQAA